MIPVVRQPIAPATFQKSICGHERYVLLDGQRVAPKWLVSQLTNYPVGSFTTDKARRLLGQLGIEVHRA
jgi:hypothetical protein